MKQGLKEIRDEEHDNGVGSFLFDDLDLQMGIYVGDEHDGPKPVLDSVLHSDSGGVVLDPGIEQASDLAFRQASNDFYSALPADGWEVGSVVGEDSFESTLDLSAEFGDAAFNYLSHPKRSRRSELISISEEDFDGPERLPFRTLYDHVVATFAEKISQKKRMQAIEWVFCPVDDPITFTMCCRALGMRPNVLRTRIHYEFFKQWKLYPAFPFLTVPIPDELVGEILYLTGEIGVDIAAYAWRSPGINFETIIALAGQKYRDYEIEKVILDLKAAGIMGLRMKNVYLIGRNPDRESEAEEVEVNRKTKRKGFWSSYW